MKNFVSLGIVLMSILGCSSTPESTTDEKTEPTLIKKSYLGGRSAKKTENTFMEPEVNQASAPRFANLESLIESKAEVSKKIANTSLADDKTLVTMAANGMPLPKFIHYVFGEVLGTNYIVDNEIKNSATGVTLNITQPTSKLDVFRLVVDLLSRNQITIDHSNGSYFLQKAELSKAKASIGIGRQLSDIPLSSGQILQVVPLKYGVKGALERTVKQLVDAAITVDFEQSALFVLGDKANVQRTIELVNILDVPANRGKYIGLMNLTYITINDFIQQAIQVLQAEGIMVGGINDITKSVYMIPLPHIGSVAVFATDEDILNRIRYWGEILDQPTQGESAQYFVYEPEFARASDLGESIGELLTIGRTSIRNESTTGNNADVLKSESSSSQKTFSSQDISFVIDERSNSLIFNTKGSFYQNLLPLLKKLDVLPKQILLEVIIAEVTLTNEFKYGVEFALKNSSRFSVNALNPLSSQSNGLNLTFIDSNIDAKASFFKDNQLVNILSNPTLLVRDGVSASISVGTEIPVQSGTIVDEGVQTTNVDYRSTGVDITVTPTVNAQGVVIMEINQLISNTVDATVTSTTPSIFKRSLNTEAVVDSGQTVILGGLISEDVTIGKTKVPGIGDLPLIGGIFGGQENTKTKTELVMLVTPKVITSNNEWDKIIEDFTNGLENVRFEN